MSRPEFVVAIPARHGSSRLPGKPLLSIAGRPMIAHVVDRALAAGAAEVVVATDDRRIADVVAGLGIACALTSPEHASGTDRLAECARIRDWPDELIVVNLQGDEPLAPPEAIRCVADILASRAADIATLALPIDDAETLFEPNVVKVVVDQRGDALYFSRAPIPWHRDAFAVDRTLLPDTATPAWLRHVGMYAYRTTRLRQFAAMPPGRLERLEALEQLRALEAGWRIAVATSPVAIPAGVDTLADLERVRALFGHAG